MKLQKLAWVAAAAACMVQCISFPVLAEETSDAQSSVSESSASEELVSGDYEYTVNENGDAVITDYVGSDAALVIPSEIENHTVVEFGSGAFALQDTLTEITLPDTLETIGSSCFYGCTSLENLLVADGNENFKVEDGVLFSADGKDLYLYPPEREGNAYTVPDGVVEIRSSSFSNAALTSVKLPDGLLYINEWAFGWTKLESLELPETVREIGQYAFAYCTGLKEVTFPTDLELIEAAAFAGDSNLEKVTFSDAGNLTEIQMAAFAGTAMKEVTIPDSVTYIGFCAFGYEEDMETPVDNFVVYGSVGSQAQRYCTDEDSENNYSNSFTFQSVMSENVENEDQTVEVQSQKPSIWQEYGKWILLGVAALLLIVVGIILLVSGRKERKLLRHQKQNEAERAAMPAENTAEAVEKTVEQSDEETASIQEQLDEKTDDTEIMEKMDTDDAKRE